MHQSNTIMDSKSSVGHPLAAKHGPRNERHVKILMLYLADHDPAMLRQAQVVQSQFSKPCGEMKQRLRKTIGEEHWYRYLDFYFHFMETGGERIKVEKASVVPALPPPFPSLSKDLNDDVTSKIFEFLDGKAMHGASQVSRSFRDALIPRQKIVALAGFKSFESFRQLGFVGMETFVADDCKLATVDNLKFIVRERAAFPKLVRVYIANFAGDLLGRIEFHNGMGPRLDEIQKRPHPSYEHFRKMTEVLSRLHSSTKK